MKRLTTQEFIKRSRKIHGDCYDYSLVKYINAHTKVKIVCKKHGIFYKEPFNHSNNKQGCPKCSNIKRAKNRTLTNQKFINVVKKIHNNKYDYSKCNYHSYYVKICIVCPIHGEFWQTPNNHRKGYGCPKCGNIKCSTKEFIKKAIKIHGNKYDYSLVNYIHSHTKIKIKCSIHGIFNQTPTIHLRSGCPKCNVSKGELQIERWLKKHNINHIYQKTFHRCKGIKNPLPFDFYLPNYNICIEFDGKQHFEPINFQGKYKSKAEILKEFNNIKTNDNIKNEYCKNNNIKLIRIPYTIKDINKFLQLYIS